jgi:outer membrane receptor protein involved in Fe transport
VNVPKSEIKGAEVQVTWLPIRGLTLNASATYLDTEITKFVGVDQTGTTRDFSGNPLPYTPKWQAVADAEYRFPISGQAQAFFGGNLTYNSDTNGSVGRDTFAKIPDFFVLDLRAGVAAPDGRWRVNLYGRNVTNKYYWNNAFSTQDVILRYAAKPATYGVAFSFRFD